MDTETVLENIYQNQIKNKEYLDEAVFGNLGNYEKQNKYPALGVYQTSNPSGRLVELKLGVDIGSTSSKAVIRFPYETFGPFAVPALDGLQADNNPYYWRTEIYEAKGGTFTLVPSKRWFRKREEATLHKNLKVKFLIKSEKSSDLSTKPEQEIVHLIAFISLFMKQCLGWMAQHNPQLKKQNVGTFVNFGFPAKNFEQSNSQRVFSYCCEIALELLREDKVISETSILSVWKERNQSKMQKNESFQIVPELVGAVTGFSKSKESRPGKYFLLDVGGLTIDSAFFGIRKSPDTQLLNIGIYSSSSQKYGSEIYKLAGKMGLGDDGFSSVFKKIFCEQVHSTYDLLNHVGMEWYRETLPTFLIGGGTHFKIYEDSLQISNVSMAPARWARKFEKRKISQMNDLEYSVKVDVVPDRLLVAYGLSFSEFDIPEWYKPNQILAGVAPKKFDLNERYVGPEQT